MTVQIIISSLLFYLAWCCNGMMDRMQFHWVKVPRWMKKRSGFWHPVLSWSNKWELDKKGLPIVGMERFLFSSTLLIFLTDGWHLLKELMIECICIALAVAFGVWWYYFIFRTIMILGFNTTYR